MSWLCLKIFRYKIGHSPSQNGDFRSSIRIHPKVTRNGSYNHQSMGGLLLLIIIIITDNLLLRLLLLLPSGYLT